MGPAAPTEEEARLPQLLKGPDSSPQKAFWKLFPSGLKYLLANEIAERYVFYGVKAVLALYLYQHLHLSENTATELFHLFVVVTYTAVLLGAYFSDGLWGYYVTILRLEVLYFFGVAILLVSSVPDPDVTYIPLWGSALGIFLIAFTAGGSRPCIPTFGANQIEYSVQGNRQLTELLQSRFFSVFYFFSNFASVITKLLTPYLRANTSYATAFSVSTGVMLFAVGIFWWGRRTYVSRAPERNVFSSVGRILWDAVKLGRGRKSEGADARLLLNGRDGEEEVEHWLDHAKVEHGETEVEDLKRVLRVLVFLLPATVFWSLADQQGSKWVFQGSQMDGRISWLGGLVIQPDQMVVLNPSFVLIMIPLVDLFIYPFVERMGVSLHYIRRMVLGMLMNASAFVVAAIVQLAIYRAASTEAELGRGRISILWQVPQYVLITAGEVLFSITGLAFAYSEAPASMKVAVQSAWELTIAGGNVVTIILVAIIGERLSKANEFLVFAGLCTLAAAVMAWLGVGFSYRQPAENNEDSVSNVSHPIQALVTSPALAHGA